jgi:pimeloyl-ACP methyl ester carboxylesterase
MLELYNFAESTCSQKVRLCLAEKNLDFVDRFAKEREVILFDNAGVSSSSGDVPGSFAEMGANAIAFIKALGLKEVDVLGFSIGGLVAQEITLQAPALVRRLVLVGTGPRSGESMDTGTPEGNQIFGATYEHPDDLWLRVHFTPSEVSQAAGRKFLKRFRLRTKDRDPEVTEKAALAQRTAIARWGAKREHAWDYLKEIKQPTLVVNVISDSNPVATVLYQSAPGSYQTR